MGGTVGGTEWVVHSGTSWVVQSGWYIVGGT